MSSNDSDKTTDTSNNTSSSSSSGKGIGDIDLTKIVTTFTSSATNSDFQVDCGTLYEGFSRCMSPGEQLTNIHRYGQAQDCSIFFDDWKKCLYSRMTNDKQKIKDLYESTSYYQQKQIPENDIFTYKAKPSWE